MDGMDGMGNVSIPMTPVKIQRFAPEKCGGWKTFAFPFGIFSGTM